MARECLGKCPRIKEILSDMEFNNFISGPGPIHADSISEKTGGERLLEAAGDSYSCPGPFEVTRTVERRIGFLGLGGAEQVQETVLVCGLDRRSRSSEVS